MSAARARGAQVMRSTSERVKHTLAGILPVPEHWHAKVSFMEVNFLLIHLEQVYREERFTKVKIHCAD